MKPIVYWLKRVFTIQTIALLIAVISLLVTWRQLDVSTSGDVQLRLNSNEGKVNVTNVEQCCIYKSTGRDTLSADYLMPEFYNGDNKSVKNLAFSVRLFSYNCYFLDFNGDSIQYVPNREYLWEFNQLSAFMSKPLPIKSVVLTDSLFARFRLNLKVSYDGIERPLIYTSEVDLVKYGDNLGDPLFSNVYIQWRNIVFDEIYEKFDSEERSSDKYCIVIGDTIIPSINNMQVFDRKNSRITSLSEIAPHTDWSENFLIFLFLIYLIYCARLIRFVPALIGSLKYSRSATGRHDISKFISNAIECLTDQHGLSTFEAYVVLFLAIPSSLFFVFVIAYMWLSWGEIMN